MKKRWFYFFPALMILGMLFASCAKEPTVSAIEATINGYEVTFKVTVTDADTYLWNFGDTQTSTEASPKHAYVSSGTYNVSLTVSGKGGEATTTKEVKIPPSFSEMLTGGSAATNGKTWVLSTGYTAGVDGGSVVDNSMFVMLPTFENVLTVIGLGAEYDNEFTFYADGKYKVDVKNGKALIAGIYGMVTGTTVDVGNENNVLGIYAGTYTAPASATWTLHEGNLVVDAIINPTDTVVPAPHEMRTITGKKWVSLSEGAFFGILDFPSTRQFIVKEITADKMSVAMFVCGYFADPNVWSIPSYLYHLTYVPKK
jgi:PKD repeat protein